MNRSLTTLLLLCTILVVTLRETEAKKKSRPKINYPCAYDVASTVGPCDQETAKQLVKYVLIRGPRQHCKVKMIKKEDCLGCKYDSNIEWSACINGEQSKEEELLPRSKHISHCPMTRRKTKKCFAVVDFKRYHISGN